MKRIQLIILTLLLVSLVKAQLPAARPAVDKEIRNLLRQQEEAWNKGNLDGFMALYENSTDLAFITKKGIKRGWSKVYSGYQLSYFEPGKNGTLNFDILNIFQTASDQVTVVGTWKVSTSTDLQSGYFTLWLSRKKGHWKIVMDHTS